jgi:DNA repair exonuclease SbcCD ATPase subunit
MMEGINQEKFLTMAKWGIVLLAVAVLAPIALLVIKGILGISIAVVVGVVGINAAPVLATKMSNWKYRALDAAANDHIEKVATDAAKNPIETLQNQLVEKQQAISVFTKAVTDFGAQVLNFKDQMDGFKKEYPADASKFEAQYQSMLSVLNSRKDQLTNAKEKLNESQDALKRLQSMWKMSQAAQNINKMAGMNAAAPFEKIKTESAIDSVMNSMNQAFAEMETSLTNVPQGQQTPQLVNSQTVVPMLETTVKSEKVRV